MCGGGDRIMNPVAERGFRDGAALLLRGYPWAVPTPQQFPGIVGADLPNPPEHCTRLKPD